MSALHYTVSNGRNEVVSYPTRLPGTLVDSRGKGTSLHVLCVKTAILSWLQNDGSRGFSSSGAKRPEND